MTQQVGIYFINNSRVDYLALMVGLTYRGYLLENPRPNADNP